MGWFGNLRKVKCREKAWKGYTETEVVFSVGFFDHPEGENSQKRKFSPFTRLSESEENIEV
jgi:hypothetical protein